MNQRTLTFDPNGNISVRNLSAFWIPEHTFQEVINGTVYTVTGSYDGNEPFIRKLERITSRQMAEDLAADPAQTVLQKRKLLQ